MGLLGQSRSKTVKELEEALAELKRGMPGLQRVGTIRLDLLALQTRLRSQVPSLRIEEDGTRLLLFADHALSEGEFNRVQQEFRDVVAIDRS